MNDIALLSVPAGLNPVSADDNDFQFANGDLVLVSGHDRKLQDVIKILITGIGSNPVFDTYGSALPTVPGTRDVSTNDKISSSVKSAIAFLTEVETSQLLSENIAGIQSLTVKNDPTNPAGKIATLVVVLKDGQTLTFARRM